VLKGVLLLDVVPRFRILVPGLLFFGRFVPEHFSFESSFLSVLFSGPRFWVLVPQSSFLVQSAVTRPTSACIGTDYRV
jgi:hypothetical protein